MSDLAKYEGEPNLPSSIAETVKESEMTRYIHDHLTWMQDDLGLPLRENVVGLLVYYLEDIGATKRQVQSMLKAFPKSKEMSDCVRYDRSPMPRDFLDVFDRVNNRASSTRVGDSDQWTP